MKQNPQIIQSDSGGEFTNGFPEELLREMGIVPKFGASYSPWT